MSCTVWTTLATSRSGGSFQHFPHLLFLCITFILTFFHASGVNSFCFMISLKICLTISVVSRPHALMSSSLIPLLSGDLPFFEFVDCSLQLFCRKLWDSHHHIGVAAVHVDAALSFVLTEFLFSFFLFIVVVLFFFFGEITKDIGIPFPRRDVVMSTFLFADLIPGMFFTPLKSSSIRWMSCCLFILFCP